MTQEEKRLEENRIRKAYWRRWGPYLSERRGVQCELHLRYSLDYFPMMRSRAYRWGKMALLEFLIIISDFVWSRLWNGWRSIKERLFGVLARERVLGSVIVQTNPQHNVATLQLNNKWWRWQQDSQDFGLDVEVLYNGGLRIDSSVWATPLAMMWYNAWILHCVSNARYNQQSTVILRVTGDCRHHLGDRPRGLSLHLGSSQKAIPASWLLGWDMVGYGWLAQW